LEKYESKEFEAENAWDNRPFESFKDEYDLEEKWGNE